MMGRHLVPEDEVNPQLVRLLRRLADEIERGALEPVRIEFPGRVVPEEGGFTETLSVTWRRGT
jgi:hypothetical protein